MRRFGIGLVTAMLTVAACGGSDPADFETLLLLDDALPGDAIALRSGHDELAAVEFVDRRAGTISVLFADSGELAEMVDIDVGTEGEQRGLLGHTIIDGRRFAAWTEPDTLDLVVGEVTNGGVDRLVWAGTGTSPKAVGGHLESRGGLLVLGIGSLTDWGRDNGSGAIVTLDPDGSVDQEPVVISGGWNNPFAFTVIDNGTIWVADNAPDGSDLPVAERDGERIATAPPSGAELTEPPPQRAPSAIVELPDGRLGVCGFLDNEMRAYGLVALEDSPIADDGTPMVSQFDRAGTIGPCLTGAAVLADGSVVTASLDGDTPALLIRPAR